MNHGRCRLNFPGIIRARERRLNLIGVFGLVDARVQMCARTRNEDAYQGLFFARCLLSVWEGDSSNSRRYSAEKRPR